MQRVIERSFQKFGNRIFQGGDLYEKEEIFFNFVKSRTENSVEMVKVPKLHYHIG